MTAGGRAGRRRPATVVAALLAALLAAVAAPVVVTPALAAGGVTLTVDSVTPTSPTASTKPRAVAFELTLTNTTAATLRDVTVTAVRSDPIASVGDLDAALSRLRAPTADQESPVRDASVRVTLGAGATVSTTFRTTTGTDVQQSPGICLCATRIYPIYFTAAQVASNGSSVELAHAQTYLPSFTQTDAKQLAQLHVGWLWPLLDHPHRIIRDKIFTDDDLADEVAVGGRLSNMLQVAERVAARGVPLTLVTDPELLDELAVMSTGYVVSTNGTLLTGTGGDAAAQWLARLRAVLAKPDMEITFTAVADPNVDALTTNGLPWHARPNPTVRQRLAGLLGDGVTPVNDITWPAGQAVSAPTLSSLAAHGSTIVVLADGLFPQTAGERPALSGLAPIRTRNGSLVAAVTSGQLERSVRQIVGAGADGLALLPRLVAQLAVRVVANQLAVVAGTAAASSPYVVLTPPRQLRDVAPDVAAQMILATSRTQWSTPLPLQAATGSQGEIDHGTFRGRAGSRGIPAAAVAQLRYVTDSMHKLSDLYYQPGTTTLSLLDGLPGAVQRCESTSLAIVASRSVACARFVARTVRRIRDGVHLVKPSGSQTYTLASRTSSLPVTITNTLAETVQVRIGVTNVDDAAGFSVDTGGLRRIRPNSTVQVRLPTHLDRVGLISVRVTLRTDSGLELGAPVPLNVRGTALGAIGVIITIVAGAVLLIALVLRAARRIRLQRRTVRT